MKFIEKYKKKLITASITAGIAIQIGSAYGGYVVYGKFKKIERHARVLKAKLKRFKTDQDDLFDHLRHSATVINKHSRDLTKVVPKVIELEKKLRKLERKWK